VKELSNPRVNDLWNIRALWAGWDRQHPGRAERRGPRTSGPAERRGPRTSGPGWTPWASNIRAGLNAVGLEGLARAARNAARSAPSAAILRIAW